MSSETREVRISNSGGMGWFFLAVIVVMISYDNEIRCALGKRIACDIINMPDKSDRDAQTAIEGGNLEQQQ